MNLKRISVLVLAWFLLNPQAKAVDGVYLGGVVGAAGLAGAGATDTAIGFGADLGLRANSVVDVMFHFQTSSHTGASIYTPHLSAELHYADVNDFDFTVGVGPGFYFVKSPATTNTNFGLNFGTAADLKLDEAIRLGMGFRYHVVFSGTNYWTFLFRAGYFFEW